MISQLHDDDHDLVVIGKIIRAHGVRGEVKVIPLSNIPGRLKTLETVVIDYVNGDRATCNIEHTRGEDDAVIMKFAHVDTRDDADNLRNAYLSVSKKDVPLLDDGSYYDYELIGMVVVSETGDMIGSIQRIDSYPSIDLLVIQKKEGLLYLPAVRDYVLSVDTGIRKVTVRVPDDLPDMSGN